MFHTQEQYRLKTTSLASDSSYGCNGAFLIPHYKIAGYFFVIIMSDGDVGSDAWEHVSVTLMSDLNVPIKLLKSSSGGTVNRCPTWEEMCFVKDQFWDKDDTVIQFHPAESDYVNNHPYCLHLWRPVGVDFPKPDKLMIGLQKNFAAMKTPEELMQPRYKVIADFWDNPFKVGDVLSFVVEDGTSVHQSKLGGLFYFEDQFSSYPNLFRKLEWWEDLNDEDMPEYLKRINDGRVFKIASWNGKNADNIPLIALEYKPEEFHGLYYVQVLKYFLPSTKEQFESQ